jgi:hypothetical protein
MSCPSDRALVSSSASFAIVSVDGVSVGDGEALGVVVGVVVGVGDAPGAADVDGDGDADAGDADALGDADGLTLAGGDPVGLALVDGEGDAVGVGDVDAIGCGRGLAGGAVGDGVAGPSALAGEANSQTVVASAIAAARKIRARTSPPRLPHRAK